MSNVRIVFPTCVGIFLIILFGFDAGAEAPLKDVQGVPSLSPTHPMKMDENISVNSFCHEHEVEFNLSAQPLIESEAFRRCLLHVMTTIIVSVEASNEIALVDITDEIVIGNSAAIAPYCNMSVELKQSVRKTQNMRMKPEDYQSLLDGVVDNCSVRILRRLGEGKPDVFVVYENERGDEAKPDRVLFEISNDAIRLRLMRVSTLQGLSLSESNGDLIGMMSGSGSPADIMIPPPAGQCPDLRRYEDYPLPPVRHDNFRQCLLRFLIVATQKLRAGGSVGPHFEDVTEIIMNPSFANFCNADPDQRKYYLRMENAVLLGADNYEKLMIQMASDCHSRIFMSVDNSNTEFVAVYGYSEEIDTASKKTRNFFSETDYFRLTVVSLEMTENRDEFAGAAASAVRDLEISN